MKPIVIRFSLGDLIYVWDTVYAAFKYGSWRVIRASWWTMREERRRDVWKPWTIGDHVMLCRMGRWLATDPDLRGPRPTPWCHAPRSDADSP